MLWCYKPSRQEGRECDGLSLGVYRYSTRRMIQVHNVASSRFAAILVVSP